MIYFKSKKVREVTFTLGAMILVTSVTHGQASRIPPPAPPLTPKLGIVNGWQVKWKKGKTEFSADQPIILTFELENVSQAPKKVAVGSILWQCPVVVKDTAGLAVPRTLQGRIATDPGGSVFMATIAPNSSLEYEIHLNSIFDMSMGGKYFVTASRLVENEDSNCQTIEVATDPLEISVKPVISMALVHVNIPEAFSKGDIQK